MKFKYYKLPTKPTPAFPDRKYVFRPMVRITARKGEKNMDLLALIDSGSDVCLFPAKVGEILGLNIEAGKIEKIGGIGAGSLEAYFQDIQLEIGGHQFSCYAGFHPDQTTPPLLGQHGFFDKFKIVFIRSKEEMEINQKF